MEDIPLTKDIPMSSEPMKTTAAAITVYFDEEKKDDAHPDTGYHDIDSEDDEEKAKKPPMGPVGSGGGSTSSELLLSTQIISWFSQKVRSLSNVSAKTKRMTKRVFSIMAAVLAITLVLDYMRSPPESRLIRMSDIRAFLLRQVNERPVLGLCTFVIAYGSTVVVLLPATPLTLGVGYVCVESYGWVLGVFLATLSSMLGSLLGSVFCFVVSRYLMRDTVRNWGRKRYPIFDAIDLAVSDNGLKIMSLLYLTPILPLGPVSYMMGTTSMRLSSFAMAKLAALPLMILYVFIGASTGTLVGDLGGEDETAIGKRDLTVDKSVGGGTKIKEIETDAESKHKLMLFGLVLSVVSIALVSHFVKKELYGIFEKQKEGKQKAESIPNEQADENVELGLLNTSGVTRHRRQRIHSEEAGGTKLGRQGIYSEEVKGGTEVAR